METVLEMGNNGYKDNVISLNGELQIIQGP